MRRFVYAPDVNAYIMTDSGLIDVSDDIISGSVTRRISAVSSAQLTLQNPNRKYLRKQVSDGTKLTEVGDLVFKPMDRITIFLTRTKSIQVFSGYIDRAPYDQLYPGPVNITASCTLKRLMHTYWDPGLVFVQKWMSTFGWVYDQTTGNMQDPNKSLFNFDFSGGLGFLLYKLLNVVGGWPVGEDGKPNTVHILELPDEFIKRTETILKNQIADNVKQQKEIEDLIKVMLTPEGILSALNPDGSAAGVAKSSYTNTNPLPGNVAGDYPAKIFGEKTVIGGPGDPALRSKAATYANKYGIPVENLFGMIDVENGGYAWADRTSSAGAIGYTQVVPPKYGYNATDLHDPDKNFDAGAHYLSDQFKTFRNWHDAYQAYNGGPGGVGKSYTEQYARTALDYAAKEKVNLQGAGSGANPEGVIGDVHTSMRKFFDSNNNGYTFTAKKNPFGDDSLVFKAKFDSGTPSGKVSFYVPGAANNAPPWADKWNDHDVTVSGTAPTASGASTAGSSISAAAPAAGAASTIADKVVQVAIGQVGVHEVGYNTGPTVDKYLAYAGGSPGQPWCAAFVSWVFGQAGVSTVKTLSAPHMTSYGTDSFKNPAPGNVVVWSGDHTGIVVSVAGNQFYTVEGNAGNNTNAVVRGGPYTVGVPTADVHGDIPSFVSVTGVGAGAGVDPSGTIGTTGVQISQQQISQIAASTTAGWLLGFPAVADVIESQYLSGKRALANDVPLLEWVEFICKASGRNFMSTPRGDFIAFYPDYFNWSGDGPYFTISGIETIDCSIDVGDEELTTHVFTTGDTYPGTLATNPLIDKLASTVASVEETETFKTLINAKGWDDAKAGKFLTRYGARPYHEERPEIKHSLLQFMYGWMLFQEKWAKQFYCDAMFTFMPELIPGGLVDFWEQDIILYVQEVTHTFDRASGFSTSASLIAPSTKGGYNPAMVLAGQG